MARADLQWRSRDISYVEDIHTWATVSQGMPIQYLMSATLVGSALTSFCVRESRDYVSFPCRKD